MRIDRLFSSKKNRSIRRRDRASRSSRVPASYQVLEDRKMLAGDVWGPQVPSSLETFGGSTVAVSPIETEASATTFIIDGEDIDPAADPHPSAGLVGSEFGGFFCSGVLIAPTYLLTAAHCVTDSFGGITVPSFGETEGRFEIGGEVYSSVRVEAHPDWNGLANGSELGVGDIAVIELERPVTNVTPSRFLRNSPTVGEELTLVGFGLGGNGVDGAIDPFGIKRVGTTQLETIEETRLLWVFDDGESSAAPGDSGGPAFVNINGEFVVAGVTSGGIGGEGLDASSPTFGVTNVYTRTDFYQQFIDDFFSGRDEHGDFPDATATFIQHGTDGIVRTDGRLQRVGDHDVFRVQFRQQSFVVFRVNGIGMDSFLRMYNQAGLQLTQNDNYEGTNSRIAVSVQPGTYYFSVESNNDAETGNFNVWSRLTTFGETTVDDHADTADENATIYTLNDDGTGRQSGRIAGTVDRDVFQINAQERGTAFVRVNGSDGLNPDLQVFDSLGRSVATNDDFAGTLNSGLNFQFLPGTYFISVGASGQRSTGNFNIWSNFVTFVPRDDHGGFINNSTGVSLATNGSAFASGVITDGNDRDMFFFTTTRSSSQYVIRVAGLSNNLDTTLSLFNSAGQRIATNDDTFGTDSRIFFSASAGDTFYVAVDGKENSTGQYNLAIFRND